jgi:hypothetical protein
MSARLLVARPDETEQERHALDHADAGAPGQPLPLVALRFLCELGQGRRNAPPGSTIMFLDTASVPPTGLRIALGLLSLSEPSPAGATTLSAAAGPV